MQIPLLRGGFALVSSCDFERVLKVCKWYEKPGRRTSYAMGYIGNRNKFSTKLLHGSVYMHHFILGSNDMCDHDNRNGLHNFRENLTKTTYVLNARNRLGANLNSSTGIRGVRIYGEKFIAQININGRNKHIGVFLTLTEADEARKKAEEILWKQKSSYLNQ